MKSNKENLELWSKFLKRVYGMPGIYELKDTTKKKDGNIWKIIAVILGVVFLLEVGAGIVYFGFIIEDGKLKGLFSTNTTINIDTPDVNITNEYEHNIYVNTTINIDIPGEINITIKNESQ